MRTKKTATGSIEREASMLRIELNIGSLKVHRDDLVPVLQYVCGQRVVIMRRADRVVCGDIVTGALGMPLVVVQIREES